MPGNNNYEYTQPIQMRFNELLSGVRSDVAIKVFGDDMDTMNASAEAISRVLESVPGAADVKVEQTTGLPMLTIQIDHEKTARLGINVGDVQDAVSIALGGREAGVLFEGDRRFDIIVRLPERLLISPAVPLTELRMRLSWLRRNSSCGPGDPVFPGQTEQRWHRTTRCNGNSSELLWVSELSPPPRCFLARKSLYPGCSTTRDLSHADDQKHGTTRDTPRNRGV